MLNKTAKNQELDKALVKVAQTHNLEPHILADFLTKQANPFVEGFETFVHNNPEMAENAAETLEGWMDKAENFGKDFDPEKFAEELEKRVNKESRQGAWKDYSRGHNSGREEGALLGGLFGGATGLTTGLTVPKATKKIKGLLGGKK